MDDEQRDSGSLGRYLAISLLIHAIVFAISPFLPVGADSGVEGRQMTLVRVPNPDLRQQPAPVRPPQVTQPDVLPQRPTPQPSPTPQPAPEPASRQERPAPPAPEPPAAPPTPRPTPAEPAREVAPNPEVQAPRVQTAPESTVTVPPSTEEETAADPRPAEASVPPIEAPQVAETPRPAAPPPPPPPPFGSAVVVNPGRTLFPKDAVGMDGQFRVVVHVTVGADGSVLDAALDEAERSRNSDIDNHALNHARRAMTYEARGVPYRVRVIVTLDSQQNLTTGAGADDERIVPIEE